MTGGLLDDIIPVLSTNLHPDKDPELRLKLFSLLCRLVVNTKETLDSQSKFGPFVVTVVHDMILPNCVWHGGRTAAAIRSSAVSCLWALLQSKMLSVDEVSSVIIAGMHMMKGIETIVIIVKCGIEYLKNYMIDISSHIVRRKRHHK